MTEERRVDLVRLPKEERFFEVEAVFGRDATSVFPTEAKKAAEEAGTLTSEAVLEALGARRFISETELDTLRATRGVTADDGAVAADKPLAEILRERKAAKDAEHEEKWKLMKIGKNRPLDAEELQFLDVVAEAEAERERAWSAMERAELEAFKAAVRERSAEPEAGPSAEAPAPKPKADPRMPAALAAAPKPPPLRAVVKVKPKAGAAAGAGAGAGPASGKSGAGGSGAAESGRGLAPGAKEGEPPAKRAKAEVAAESGAGASIAESADVDAVGVLPIPRQHHEENEQQDDNQDCPEVGTQLLALQRTSDDHRAAWHATLQSAAGRVTQALFDLVVVARADPIIQAATTSAAGSGCRTAATACTPSSSALRGRPVVVVGDGSDAVDAAAAVALLNDGRGVRLLLTPPPGTEGMAEPTASVTAAAAATSVISGGALLEEARRRALAAALRPHPSLAAPSAVGRALLAPTKRRFWAYVKGKLGGSGGGEASGAGGGGDGGMAKLTAPPAVVAAGAGVAAKQALAPSLGTLLAAAAAELAEGPVAPPLPLPVGSAAVAAVAAALPLTAVAPSGGVVLTARSAADPGVMPFLDPAIRQALLDPHSCTADPAATMSGSAVPAGERGRLLLYRGVAHPAAPGLVFVGHEVNADTELGTQILEAQVRWIVSLAAGLISLPPAAEMAADLDRQRSWRAASLALPFMSDNGSLSRSYDKVWLSQLERDLQGVAAATTGAPSEDAASEGPGTARPRLLQRLRTAGRAASGGQSPASGSSAISPDAGGFGGGGGGGSGGGGGCQALGGTLAAPATPRRRTPGAAEEAEASSAPLSVLTGLAATSSGGGAASWSRVDVSAQLSHRSASGGGSGDGARKSPEVHSEGSSPFATAAAAAATGGGGDVIGNGFGIFMSDVTTSSECIVTDGSNVAAAAAAGASKTWSSPVSTPRTARAGQRPSTALPTLVETGQEAGGADSGENACGGGGGGGGGGGDDLFGSDLLGSLRLVPANAFGVAAAAGGASSASQLEATGSGGVEAAAQPWRCATAPLSHVPTGSTQAAAPPPFLSQSSGQQAVTKSTSGGGGEENGRAGSDHGSTAAAAAVAPQRRRPPPRGFSLTNVIRRLGSKRDADVGATAADAASCSGGGSAGGGGGGSTCAAGSSPGAGVAARSVTLATLSRHRASSTADGAADGGVTNEDRSSGAMGVMSAQIAALRAHLLNPGSNPFPNVVPSAPLSPPSGACSGGGAATGGPTPRHSVAGGPLAGAASPAWSPSVTPQISMGGGRTANTAAGAVAPGPSHNVWCSSSLTAPSNIVGATAGLAAAPMSPFSPAGSGSPHSPGAAAGAPSRLFGSGGRAGSRLALASSAASAVARSNDGTSEDGAAAMDGIEAPAMMLSPTTGRRRPVRRSMSHECVMSARFAGATVVPAAASISHGAGGPTSPSALPIYRTSVQGRTPLSRMAKTTSNGDMSHLQTSGPSTPTAAAAAAAASGLTNADSVARAALMNAMAATAPLSSRVARSRSSSMKILPVDGHIMIEPSSYDPAPVRQSTAGSSLNGAAGGAGSGQSSANVSAAGDAKPAAPRRRPVRRAATFLLGGGGGGAASGGSGLFERVASVMWDGGAAAAPSRGLTRQDSNGTGGRRDKEREKEKDRQREGSGGSGGLGGLLGQAADAALVSYKARQAATSAAAAALATARAEAGGAPASPPAIPAAATPSSAAAAATATSGTANAAASAMATAAVATRRLFRAAPRRTQSSLGDVRGASSGQVPNSPKSPPGTARGSSSSSQIPPQVVPLRTAKPPSRRRLALLRMPGSTDAGGGGSGGGGGRHGAADVAELPADGDHSPDAESDFTMYGEYPYRTPYNGLMSPVLAASPGSPLPPPPPPAEALQALEAAGARPPVSVEALAEAEVVARAEALLSPDRRSPAFVMKRISQAKQDRAVTEVASWLKEALRHRSYSGPNAMPSPGANSQPLPVVQSPTAAYGGGVVQSLKSPDHVVPPAPFCRISGTSGSIISGDCLEGEGDASEFRLGLALESNAGSPRASGRLWPAALAANPPQLRYSLPGGGLGGTGAGVGPAPGSQAGSTTGMAPSPRGSLGVAAPWGSLRALAGPAVGGGSGNFGGFGRPSPATSPMVRMGRSREEDVEAHALMQAGELDEQ
ncbi:hypothetical protein HYH03_007236 [Edaphochlamys debaryana]|uniref:FAM192A/Fyv6 N-terminal domain-containing protein n=1 Tax=Edaphochlamys debaryana TaxID=47281 RepID=A0A835Y3W5_9CHLO|nr:hypothetical protein HYH03_007236 [Edaphochlamys debaryana]|eukprot:KAG2494722.1 hypothetical protein HYH03_007236 [Edaphochlamys debaryana]